jgi:hypothetical protein
LSEAHHEKPDLERLVTVLVLMFDIPKKSDVSGVVQRGISPPSHITIKRIARPIVTPTALRRT